MRNLRDFLNEEEDKKKSPEPKEIAPDRGADDEKFFALMSEYKITRRTDRKRASKILERARKLTKNGDVSPKAKLGAAYL